MSHSKQDGSTSYTFSSEPRTLQEARRKKNKYRATDQLSTTTTYGNIMYDTRIVRGSTYAGNETKKTDPVQLQRSTELRKTSLLKKGTKQFLSQARHEGRKDAHAQTEVYLEEIDDRVVESDVQTQTDEFVGRPVTPLFVPAKKGIDVATQLFEGELFDFDVEVKPVLEVLIGKTLEQSFLELFEELGRSRAKQRYFEELRQTVLVETQRLQEQERRHCSEVEQRRRHCKESVIKQEETKVKIAARVFAQSYLQDLVPSAFGKLHKAGYFFDSLEREIERTFVTPLMEDVCEELRKDKLARFVLDGVIRETVATRLRRYADIAKVGEARR